MQPDEEQFKRLFLHAYGRMYRLAYSLLRDDEESRDVVSEVFAHWWDEGAPLRAATEEAYLLTCVRNRCLNRIARKDLHVKLQRLYPIELSLNESADADEARRVAVARFIDNELPPQMQRVLRLCYGEGLTYRAAADRLGVSVAAVNKYIVGALKRLRARFAAADAPASFSDD